MTDDKSSETEQLFDCSFDDSEADPNYTQPDSPVVPVEKKKRAINKKNKKASASGKNALLELVNEVIWDLKHKLHSNVNAVYAAWQRIATKLNRTRDSGDEEVETDGNDDDISSQSGSKFAFLSATQSMNPRKTITFGVLNDGYTEKDVLEPSDDSPRTGDDNDSNYSCMAERNRKLPAAAALTEPVASLSQSVAEMVHKRGTQRLNTDLKYESILRNLDDMFKKMEDEDVFELNSVFVKLALEKLKKK